MTADQAEEHRPLLHFVKEGDRRYRSTSAETQIWANDGETKVKNDTYHGCGESRRLVDSNFLPNEKLTYSWRNVKVRAMERSRREPFGFGILRRARERPRDAEKQILKNVSGVAYPGELTVIMGPSGAGKTTLLNALTFRTKSNILTTGDRYLNGYRVARMTVTSLSAYVQQNDMFLNCLTVREHLMFQAMVRISENVPYRQRIQRVNEVIDELGLRKCENITILHSGDSGGISGGERKRLSFASELLTDPPIMFCDEPTSGLDSVMALNVISMLKSLAGKGKTIICTIHQPSSEMYSMFDKIILLSEGRTAFLGTQDEASAFFEHIGVPCPLNYNPADFYMQLLAVIPFHEDSSRETICAICNSFEQSPMGLKLLNDDCIGQHVEKRGAYFAEEHSFRGLFHSSPYKATWLSQFRALIWRSWLCVVKDPLLVKMRLFQNIVISIMIGILYFQQKNDEDAIFNINGVLFTFLTNMTFQNVFAVITVFCSERPVFLREHFNGMYRVDVYFLSKTLAEVPIFLALPAIFVVIAYYPVGLNPGIDHFLAALFIVILVANVATSFGYFISSISSTVTMALSIGPPIIIPFLLFGGFLLNIRSIPVYFEWLSLLSWFRYGNEALLVNQWSDIENIQCRTGNATCPKSGKLILEIYNFHPEQFCFDLLALFLLLLFFRFLAFLALLWKTFTK